jgi:hypothetical protein
MKTVVLIACASKKNPSRARAEDLYESELFRRSLAYARRLRPDSIYILSAKHGLLDLQTEIEPYNVTLNDMSAGEVRTWAVGVLEQLRHTADLRHDRFIILAGDKYRKYIVPHLSLAELPLEGLRIGEQLQFLGKPV